MKNFKIIFFIIISIFFVALLAIIIWEVYIPKSEVGGSVIVYVVQKGIGEEEIASQLEAGGIIKNGLAFRLYVILTGKHLKLQAGKYTISSSMSIAQITNKFVVGDVVRFRLVLFEGWDIEDMGKYLEGESLYTKKEFIEAADKNFNTEFVFLKSKPANLGLEGYVFPDTYYVNEGESAEDFLRQTLYNFDRKLTPDLKIAIAAEKKTIFQIITMASIIEKEVRSLKDKKIVSGILWKRIENDFPLQVDSTVNYITRKDHASVAIKDTKIDSPYNTYLYKGLPLGPISNPGINSIIAAIYPEKSPYWYYLSADGTGQTIFSKTYAEHNAAIAKYFK